jgi:hypothetical protein
MTTPTELLHEFEAATGAYLDIVHSFPEAAYNTAPFAGSWTAAQVTDHLHKSDTHLVQVLNGPVQPTHRAPDELVGNLQAIFLDFSTKLQSPEFIIPDAVSHNREQQLAGFTATRQQIGQAIASLDLTATCHMPIFGEPTRLEMIYFVIYHTRRHTNQVKHMLEKLAQLS